ncbi:MAG: tRNA lysidine(34) synthetase TilS [Phycisphaerales bacterium]|nr:tRNA lysidine(34) synthetase TilS [Phycisphaerales bacterium]
MREAIGQVPPGDYAIGVSGGADSVALLSLLRERNDLRLRVAHLNHRTRGMENDIESAFVEGLAAKWGIACTIATLEEVELADKMRDPNPSARYRAARLAFFRSVVRDNGLRGVILAHHADDQAETILQRLLRGSGPAGLVGMRGQCEVGGLMIFRPLLEIDGRSLRDHLLSIGQDWREDSSNRADRYFRNVLRRYLATRPELGVALRKLGGAMRQWVDWTRDNAPSLPEMFDGEVLADLPSPLAEESARKWLLGRGVRPDRIDPATIEALCRMAGDAASAPRRQFPGQLMVRRRGRFIGTG